MVRCGIWQTPNPHSSRVHRLLQPLKLSIAANDEQLLCLQQTSAGFCVLFWKCKKKGKKGQSFKLRIVWSLASLRAMNTQRAQSCKRCIFLQLRAIVDNEHAAQFRARVGTKQWQWGRSTMLWFQSKCPACKCVTRPWARVGPKKCLWGMSKMCWFQSRLLACKCTVCGLGPGSATNSGRVGGPQCSYFKNGSLLHSETTRMCAACSKWLTNCMFLMQGKPNYEGGARFFKK